MPGSRTRQRLRWLRYLLHEMLRQAKDPAQGQVRLLNCGAGGVLAVERRKSWRQPVVIQPSVYTSILLFVSFEIPGDEVMDFLSAVARSCYHILRYVGLLA